MKKDIAKRLNSIADDLPLIFEWENGSYEITGYELNLTPYGDKKKYEPNGVYEIPLPQMRAVEHKQQMKDAYKNGGVVAVKEYASRVMSNYRNEQVNL